MEGSWRHIFCQWTIAPGVQAPELVASGCDFRLHRWSMALGARGACCGEIRQGHTMQPANGAMEAREQRSGDLGAEGQGDARAL